MRFFKLTHPVYRSDAEESVRNPVTSKASHRLPGLVCEVCGAWSSSDRVRITLPPGVDELRDVTFVPVGDWPKVRDKWAGILNVAPEELTPGAEVGPPKGTCTALIREDAVHPMPGEVWVGSRVKAVLTSAMLTGISFERVVLNAECEAELWELIVHGRGWRKESSPGSIQLCEICGRRGFPSPKRLSVDETRWDGRDFVNVDANPNIILVTARAAEVIEASGFSNLAVLPID